jgi:hypothetical protein
VEIVTAGVHYRDFVSSIILGVDLTRVCETGAFFYGKRIEFGAQHDSGASTILENGDHTGSAHIRCDFVARLAETIGEQSGGLSLVRGEFGILMEMEVESVRFGDDGLDFGWD